MPDHDPSDADADAASGDDPASRTEGLSDDERRRRRLAVFGDVEPDTTLDDRDDDDTRAPRDSDAWLRAQVPPHHGG